MKELIALFFVCVGVYVYHFFTDKDYQKALDKSFWVCVGGVFMWANMI